MKKSAVIISIIGLIFVSFFLGIAIRYFYFRREITNLKNSEETVISQIQSTSSSSLFNRAVPSPIASSTVSFKIDQNYLTAVQKAANDFNSITKINSEISQLLLKIQQALPAGNTDELFNLANQIKSQNQKLSQAISQFKNSTNQWRILNNQLTENILTTNASALLNSADIFSQSANNYSNIITDILEGDSLIKWQLNLIKYSKKFQDSAIKMSNDQKNFIEGFNNFKNLISSSHL